MKAQSQAELEQWKIEHDSQIKLEIAKIDAETKVLAAQIAAAKTPESPQQDGETQAALAMALQGFQEALGRIGQPRQIIRDANGRAQGIV